MTRAVELVAEVQHLGQQLVLFGGRCISFSAPGAQPSPCGRARAETVPRGSEHHEGSSFIAANSVVPAFGFSF